MNRNNKLGFTLIELLAVIVILAIIAVITVPMIMNVIDKAKLGALEDSAYGLVESANLWYAENVSNEIKDTKFTIEKNKQTSDNKDITKLLSYKGTIDKGYVSILSTGKVAVCIDNNTKKIEKGYSDSKVTTSNGTCDGTFVNEVGSTDDSDVSISTIKELQNKISVVESDISDLKTQVGDLKNNLNGYITYKNFQKNSIVISANTYVEFDIPYTILAGYTAIAAFPSTTGTGNVAWVQNYINGSNIHCVIKNTATFSETANVWVRLLYIKNN